MQFHLTSLAQCHPRVHATGEVHIVGGDDSSEAGGAHQGLISFVDCSILCRGRLPLTPTDATLQAIKTTPRGMTMQLFAAIRRGKVKPGMAEEFARRVQAGALPAMQKMDGFRGYYLIAGAEDTIIAVSLFTNQAVAQISTQTLMPWIKENLGPLLASPTEAIDGTVLVSA